MRLSETSLKAKLFGLFLGQRYLTISHSSGLEAVASHHPATYVGLRKFIHFASETEGGRSF